MGLISCTFHILNHIYTIMAAYSTEGEMSQDRIDQGGLYGSLYSENKTWEVARYISVIEAAILMGIVCPLHLPFDRADHFKIVGNAIAVPHAWYGIGVWVMGYTKIQAFYGSLLDRVTLGRCWRIYSVSTLS